MLNEISPKYVGMLCDFLVAYGTGGADTIAKIYQNADVEGVEEFLNDPTTIPDLSNKAVKHAMNDHMPRRYANQLLYNNDIIQCYFVFILHFYYPYYYTTSYQQFE